MSRYEPKRSVLILMRQNGATKKQLCKCFGLSLYKINKILRSII